MALQDFELSPQAAATEAHASARELSVLVDRYGPVTDVPVIRRWWIPSAATWCYHTAIAVPAAPESLRIATGVFVDAARLPSQPWYPQFRYGLTAPLPDDVDPSGSHSLSIGVFDVGLPKPRAYRQWVSHQVLPANRQAIVMRSVASPALAWPSGVVPAYALSPSGDVLEYVDGRLVWHHICTTPGASVLPMPMDRWLINALRLLRLDGAERNTYRQELTAWADWVQQGFSGLGDLSAHLR